MWTTESSSQWEADAATKTIPATGPKNQAMMAPEITAIAVPVMSEWE